MLERTESGFTPEVSEKAKRRRFEASYKLQVLEEADVCTSLGQLEELLRREGFVFVTFGDVA